LSDVVWAVTLGWGE